MINSFLKNGYFTALNAATTDRRDPFAEFIGQRLVATLQFTLAVARGGEISSLSDMDTALEYLNSRLRNTERK